MRGSSINLSIINKFMLDVSSESKAITKLSFNGIISIQDGAINGNMRNHMTDGGAMNLTLLKLTMPLLPNYVKPEGWESDSSGFTLKQEDEILHEKEYWIIRNIIDNTSRPMGKHFVIEAVRKADDYVF